MARTASIVTRVEPEVKKRAEAVLDQLGIPMTTAIDMYLRKIALSQSIPFTLEIPNYKTPIAYGMLSFKRGLTISRQGEHAPSTKLRQT